MDNNFEIDDLESLEELVNEEEIEQAPKNTLTANKIFWNGAAIAIDGITGWTVWQITGYWYYGVIWFFAAAIPMLLHQQNYERVGNNQKQMDLAKKGILLAAGSILLMAIASGVVFVIGMTHNLVIEAVTVGVTVSLFVTQAYISYVYQMEDDEVKTKNSIARAKANANKKIKVIKAGGEVLAAGERVVAERKKLLRKYGRVNLVDHTINKIEGREKKVELYQSRQFAQEVPTVQLEKVAKSNGSNPQKGQDQ